MGTRQGWVVAGLVLAATATPVLALPDVNTPIDPTKRAAISTRDAVNPAARAIRGNAVIGGRVIPTSKIPLKSAEIGERRAAIDVTEAGEKKSIHLQTRAFPVRAAGSEVELRPSDLPASIPRLSEDQFSRILAAYRKGRVPARELVQGEIQAVEDRVSLADINRFASPRRALEEQGIPVRRAGDSGAPPTTEAARPAPWSEERR